MTDLENAKTLRSMWIDIRAGKTNSFTSKRDILRLRDIDGETLLHFAARDGSSQIVGLLLEAGADPNAASHSGITPLMMAAYCGHADVVLLLIKRGAISLDTSFGDNALIFAVRGLIGPPPQDFFPGEDESANGADHVPKAELFKSKHERGEADHQKVVEHLLSAGVPANSASENGQTAIQIAEEKGLTGLTKVLRDNK